MIKIALIVCATWVSLAYANIIAPTCQQLQKSYVTYYDSLQQSEQTRPYYTYLPKQYCLETRHKERAIIYGLHGYYGTASGFALSTTEGTFNKLANQKNLIIIYPQGMTLYDNNNNFYSSWNFIAPHHYNAQQQNDAVTHNNQELPICDLDKMKQNPIPKQPGCKTWQGVCSWTSCFDDAAYLLAIQKNVEALQQGDPTKQYLVGFSNGAMMVYRMACQYPGKFTAAAAISGTMARNMHCYKAQPKDAQNPYLKAHQTSLLMLIGSKDKTVPLTIRQEKNAPNNHYYYGRGNRLVKLWGRDMSCRSHRTINTETVLDGIRCTEYNRCGRDNDSVAFCIWGHNNKQTIDWRHAYPGAKRNSGWCVNQKQKKIAHSRPVCNPKTPHKTAMDGTHFIYYFFTHKKIATNPEV